MRAIIKNEEILDPNFLPSKILHREAELREIRRCVEDLLKERRANNLFIFGRSGVGKTTCVRFVMREVERGEIVPIYVNCWEHRTQHGIFLEMARQMGKVFPSKGVRSEDISEEVITSLLERKVLMAFDEIDKAESSDFLYPIVQNLQRASIFLITNQKDALLKIDERILSRLMLQKLEFRDYNYNEVLSILRERVKLALAPNSIDEEALEKIAIETFRACDIRVGLLLILNSARIAEGELASKITREHVVKALEKSSFRKEVKLNKYEEMIYHILEDYGELSAKELFRKFCERGGDVCDRSFRNYLRKLHSYGLIDILGKKKRVIRLK